MSWDPQTVHHLIEAAEDLSRPPLIMGILNVTPDSFSDGGRFLDPDQAVEQGRRMAAAGADLIDVGGESTRPGSTPVSPVEEARRVLPVIQRLAQEVPIALSIDTRRAAVAEAALEAGASVVNDVSGFTFDPDMPALLARRTPIAIAMHMRSTPDRMQSQARYRSLLGEVIEELWQRARKALDAGLPPRHLWIDPGIGFAKTADQNVRLLAHLETLGALGRPLVVGVSRKSFLGALTGIERPDERLFPTVAAVTAAVLGGARVLRVHDVAEVRQAILVAHAILRARQAALFREGDA
ncbi:MAG TPA: dihydropteroate synthase [Myxococcota bacterium]|nr:dihydropteroate synthase [Myxococcota bacterium]HQK50418.1 dihydropteroate synthase [Myxococcota bacterium]